MKNEHSHLMPRSFLYIYLELVPFENKIAISFQLIHHRVQSRSHAIYLQNSFYRPMDF